MITPNMSGPITIDNTSAPTPLPKPQKAKGWRRIKEIFIEEDLGTVKEKIFSNVLVPSIKDTIYTIVCSTAGLIFFGDSGLRSKGYKSSFLQTNGNRQISYSSYYASAVQPEKKLAPNMMTGYVEPMFDSYEDAKECLNSLSEIMDSYEQVTIADLYNHATVRKNGYRNEKVYNKWGWKNLANARPTVLPNQMYTLNLPAPRPLDD